MRHCTAAFALAASLAWAVTAVAETVTADIIGGKGETIGQLTLIEAPRGVLLNVEIGAGGLAPGWHGVHLHAVGDCSDIGAFKMSTGHVNVDGREHGLLNPKGPDNGDLPNLYGHADGSVTAELFTPRASLHGNAALLDGDGSALVVHANRDDHMSQPIGGAGARVACAAIKAKM